MKTLLKQLLALFTLYATVAGQTLTSTYIWPPQTPSTALIAGQPNTIQISPCPVGVDTSGSYTLGTGNPIYGIGSGYMVHISDGTASEDPFVMGGTCQDNLPVGTLVVTPLFNHPLGFTVSSSSSGIQEAINKNCGKDPLIWYHNFGCELTIPSNPTPWPVTGGIFLHASNADIRGYGAQLDCLTRRPCLQVGVQSSDKYRGNTISGMLFRAPVDNSKNPAYNGCLISSTQRLTGLATVNTAMPCNFYTGDMVISLWTDNSAYWGDVPYITVTSPTSYTYMRPGALDFPLQITPGAVALAYEAILDNAQATHFVDIKGTELGSFGHFINFFDFWDDEAARIEHYDNGSIPMVRSQYWVGSNIFSGGQYSLPDKTQNLAPVISLDGSNITAQDSACATILNSNGFYYHDTVCQAAGPWQFNIQTQAGNYQAAIIDNAYSESSVGANLLTPATSPWPGTGIAGMIVKSNNGLVAFKGAFTPFGQIQSGGTGTLPYYYFLVTRDTTTGIVMPPVLIYIWKSTGSDMPVIRWSRQANLADTILYDVVRMYEDPKLAISSPGFTWPYNGGCVGGSSQACGSVAVGITQCPGFTCTLTDTIANSTASYTINPGTWTTQQVQFLPGSYVTASTTASMESEPTGPIVGLGMSTNPTIALLYCDKYGQAQAGGSFILCLGGKNSNNNGTPLEAATVLNDGNVAGGAYPAAISKGREIFTHTAKFFPSPHHILTLCDSTPDLTKATNGYRPPASPNDCYIGTDTPAGLPQTLGMSIGAAFSISRYIQNTGDGINWKERLEANQDLYKVPIVTLPVFFNQLPPCGPLTDNFRWSIDDSPFDISLPGSILTIGGGPYHVPVWCNGKNWVVE